LALGSRGVMGGGGTRFLFESIPDLVPWGYLTDIEVGLWEKHFDYFEKK